MVGSVITVAVRGRSPLDEAALKALIISLPGLTVVQENAVPPPEILLWDPEPGGLAVSPDNAPETAVLALVRDTQELTLSSGIDGFVSKNETPAGLATAIRQVSRGQQYLSPELALAFLTQQQSAPRNIQADIGILTEREREILLLLTEGLSNKAIAARLYLSVRTVEGHLAHLFTKLDVHSRTEAALFALRSGPQER